jgi:protein-disulfide isomerase
MRGMMKCFAIAGLAAVLVTASPATTQPQKHADSSPPAAAPEGGKSFGTPSAPITMEVFSDYQCPSCRALFEQTLRPLMDDYVASGNVYLIHHDYPLPMHKYSRVAARYADAAARIGKFREVEGALFDNQAVWTESGDVEKYVAQAVGPVDMKKIDHMMPAPCKDATANANNPGCPFDAGIEKDIALGNQHQVSATPTYVISAHGQPPSTSSGVVSYEVLKQYFDYLLSKK